MIIDSTIFPWFFKRLTSSELKDHFLPVKKKKQLLRSVVTHHQTPLFVTDTTLVAAAAHEFKKITRELWPQSKLAYSFKTNYDLAQHPIIRTNGLMAEIVSEKEYLLAQSLGYTGSEIIVNGPHKPDSLLLSALKNNSLLHIDNYSEFKRLKKILPRYVKKARLGIRLRAHFGSTQSRFGFEPTDSQLISLIRQLKKMGVSLQSVHMHIGTNVASPQRYSNAAKQLTAFLRTHALWESINYLDLGGGFPSHGLPPFHNPMQKTLPLAAYIAPPLRHFYKEFPAQFKPTIIFEPGRYLVDDATIFITKVLHVVLKSNKQTITVDGSVSMMPLIWYRPSLVEVATPTFTIKNTNPPLTSTVYGASCQENDRLFSGVLPLVNTGDYLIFYAAGAYNQSMGSDFIFEKPRTHFIK